MLNKWMLTPAESAEVAYLAAEIDTLNDDLAKECAEAVHKALATFAEIRTNATAQRSWQIQCALDDMLRGSDMAQPDKVYAVRAARRVLKGETTEALTVNPQDGAYVLACELGELAQEIAAYNPGDANVKRLLKEIADDGATTAAENYVARSEEELIRHAYAVMLLARDERLTRLDAQTTADEVALALVYDEAYSQLQAAERAGEIAQDTAAILLGTLLVVAGVGMLIGFFACFMAIMESGFSLGLALLGIACYVFGYASLLTPLTEDMQDVFAWLKGKVCPAARKLVLKMATANIGAEEETVAAEQNDEVRLPKVVQKIKQHLQQVQVQANS